MKGPDKNDISRKIKEKAGELGFDIVGFAKPRILE